MRVGRRSHNFMAALESISPADVGWDEQQYIATVKEMPYLAKLLRTEWGPLANAVLIHLCARSIAYEADAHRDDLFTAETSLAVTAGKLAGMDGNRTHPGRLSSGASLCSSPPTSAQAHSSGATIRHRPLASVFIRRLGCHLGCQRMNQRTANLDSRSHYPSPESGSRLAIQCAGGSIRSPGAASCCSTSQRAAAYAREIISLTTSY